MSALRSHLAATYAPATADRHMTAVRGVLAEGWHLGLFSAESLALTRDRVGFINGNVTFESLKKRRNGA